MIYVTILGFIAGILTTGSGIPQLFKAIKTQKTRDISIGWILMVVTGTFVWSVYGFLISSLPVIVTNVVSFIIMDVLLIFKLKYK